MNWKQTLFWSFSTAAIFYYFLLFGVFVFVGQEEMQLFIPEWWYIREFLFQPGDQFLISFLQHFIETYKGLLIIGN